MTKQFKISDTKPHQYAALCYRVKKSGVKVLLVTSRDTGRWVMPKGWPVKRQDGEGSAACEAWEEAGVVGKTSGKSIGCYSYDKVLDKNTAIKCEVEIYPLEVTKLQKSYPECKQRVRRWFSISGAAKRVDEPDLAKLILGFTPNV